MTDKKILFITYDLSGYYDAIHDELNTQYKHVDYYNIASLKSISTSIFLKKHMLLCIKLLPKTN